VAKADVASQTEIKDHRVVSAEEWVAARTALLAKEKEFTQLRDELSRQRRELPWENLLNTAYNYLDLVPKGRDEDGLEFTQAWVRHHDRYED